MAADQPDPASRPRGRILIADHEPGTTIPLKYLLEQSGYEVRTASTGETTLQFIVDYNPDLVLLEAMLADPDGFEICQMVRETPQLAGTRILFVSAMTRDIDVAKGIASGADGYIIKPFSNSEIMDNVRKLLEIANGSDQ